MLSALYDSIAVVGPTACGKTRRAVEIANAFDGEIISADSRQLYRNMSIGTGKDLDEYGNVPYHMIDIAEAGEKYNLHRYLQGFHSAYQDILQRLKVPVICGGSGMYVENAVKGIRLPEVPENHELRDSLKDKTIQELANILAGYKSLHNTTDIDTPKRAIRAIEIEEYYRNNPEEAVLASYEHSEPLRCLIIGIDIPREIRRKLISNRLRNRLDEGMIDEIKSLLEKGIKEEDLIYYGLEYKFVTLYVTGKLSFEEMFKSLETAIHQFAKRQMTWFRGMEKRGTKINWLPFDLPSGLFINKVRQLLS